MYTSWEGLAGDVMLSYRPLTLSPFPIETNRHNRNSKLETGNSQTGKSAIDNSAAPLAILPEKEFIFRRSKPESI
jgi:hypothetical protein